MEGDRYTLHICSGHWNKRWAWAYPNAGSHKV